MSSADHHIPSVASLSEIRERCYVCFRPRTYCFCDQIPSILNQTHVLILQHVKERFHAFNTARIVRQALQNCELIVDQTDRLACRTLPIQERVGVLYPDRDAVPLNDLLPQQQPRQLVILDGTWHHARTLMRDLPALQRLPRYCLEPDRPSEYRIRKEPTETALSTVEATVAALSALEPDTDGFDQLLNAFRVMVDDQVRHPVRAARIRNRRGPARPPVNIPTALLNGDSGIVVAYGETSFGEKGRSRRNQSLVYWVARRLETMEDFECAIQGSNLTPQFQSHLRLTDDDLLHAETEQRFCEQWRSFLRPDDQLFVFNSGTARALENTCRTDQMVHVLKSVNVGQPGSTLDDLLKQFRLAPVAVPHKGRAGQRLGNLLAFVNYLQGLGASG